MRLLAQEEYVKCEGQKYETGLREPPTLLTRAVQRRDLK